MFPHPSVLALPAEAEVGMQHLSRHGMLFLSLPPVEPVPLVICRFITNEVSQVFPCCLNSFCSYFMEKLIGLRLVLPVSMVSTGVTAFLTATQWTARWQRLLLSDYLDSIRHMQTDTNSLTSCCSRKIMQPPARSQSGHPNSSDWTDWCPIPPST